jgi:hypothetical protein
MSVYERLARACEYVADLGIGWSDYWNDWSDFFWWKDRHR